MRVYGFSGTWASIYAHLRAARTELRELGMAEQQHCADKLVLVTEMLQAAQEYLNVSRGMLNDEDQVMVRLAYEQILNLRNRVDQLRKKVDALEGDLRRRLKAMGDPEAKSKQARGGAS